MNWKNKFHERINELWERAKDRNYKLTKNPPNKHSEKEPPYDLSATRGLLLLILFFKKAADQHPASVHSAA